jgi:ribosomal-protein-serine acetyltransferase
VIPERIDCGDFFLRRWRRADAESLWAAIEESRDHLRSFMPWADAQTPDGVRVTLARFEREWDQGGDMVLGMFSGATVVGSCGLHRRLGPDGLEIGYWVHVAHTRRGYASRAARELTTAAFALPWVRRVEIKHDRANVASEGVPRKLGFSLVGVERREPRAPAETGDFRVWRMTRDRWSAPALGGPEDRRSVTPAAASSSGGIATPPAPPHR